MEDIAREAGVSTMTVSRVFSGRSTVSAATREKVLTAARRHNYEVNTQAQNLVQKRSGFVGVAVPQRLIGTEYFGEIIRGFEAVFGGTQWDYALFSMDSSLSDDGPRLLKLHRQRRVDGLLVIAPIMDDAFLEIFAEQGFPVVVVGKNVSSAKICWVKCNDYQGITTACEHLFALGHRKIAFIAGPKDFSAARRREQAFLDFCRSKCLELPDRYLQRGNYTGMSGKEAVIPLQLVAPNHPTAIIAASDAMALGALDGIRAIGLRVPEDISLVGFDDITASAQCFPALTTVHQPAYEMAKHSAQLLQQALHHKVLPTGNVTLPVSLVVRASTAAPAEQRP